MNKLFILTITIVLFLTIPQNVYAELQVGKVPSLITLSGDNGGRVTGEKWSSDEIKDKIYCLMYVDPDEKDINIHVEQALKKENFPKDKFGSIAMINMGASWKPNFVIQSVLEGKQEEFPKTIYVKDINETLVEKWNLKSDSYDIVLFNKKGEVLMSKDGKFSEKDLDKLLKLIKENIEL